MTGTIDTPILNSPYEQPDRHYVIGPQGPTGEVKDGRRPSESFIPIAVSKKGIKGGDGSEQEGFDFDATHERREKNSLINDIRRDVNKWRRDGQYAGVTPISRKLLQHWADPTRENRVIFAQREAAETAIFLTEVAGRHAPGGNDPYKRLKTALKADVDEDAWESMYQTVSRPFPAPSDGNRIAVKVINDYGDEVMKVFEIAPPRP